MNCKCKSEIDDKLKEVNLHLVGYAFTIPGFKLVPTVKTEWIDRNKAPKGKKNNPTCMFASHCPFCGVKIEHDDKPLNTPAIAQKPAKVEVVREEGGKI